MAPSQSVKQQALAGGILLVSEAGLKLLKQELQRVKAEYADIVRQRGEAANRDADLPENPIFMDLQFRVHHHYPARIQGLMDQLTKAQVYDENQDQSKVGFGSRFTAQISRPDGNSDTSQFQLLGPVEAAADQLGSQTRVISYLSPIGRAVWGGQPGQAVDFGHGSVTILSLD